MRSTPTTCNDYRRGWTTYSVRILCRVANSQLSRSMEMRRAMARRRKRIGRPHRNSGDSNHPTSSWGLTMLSDSNSESSSSSSEPPPSSGSQTTTTTTTTDPKDVPPEDPVAGLLVQTIPIPDALRPDRVTVLAYGSLLSEASARWTFPHLTNFRYARVYGLRRVFGHPHVHLIQEKLVSGRNLASLSAEYSCDSAEDNKNDDNPGNNVAERGEIGPSSSSSSSFVVAAFDVTLTDAQRRAFLDREASYDIVTVPFYDINDSIVDINSRTATTTTTTITTREPLGRGVICLKGKDDTCRELIQDLSARHPLIASYSSLWNWPHDCGLLPADLYLRHCLLAVEKASDGRALESFRHETYLADRTTRLEDYLLWKRRIDHPQDHDDDDDDCLVYDNVMKCTPPPYLATRFGG